METILFLAPTEADGSLAKSALEALAAAKELAAALGGAPFIAGLFGEMVQPAADSIASCGAAKFLGVTGVEFAPARYSTDAAAAEALARAAAATVVIVPATARMSRVMSGVAHRLGGRVDTHAAAVAAADGAPQVSRWYYRQRMMAVLQRTHRPWVVTLDPGSVAPWQGAAGSAQVEPVAVALPAAATRTRVEGVQSPAGSQQTIRPDADLLFVAGAGWCKKQRDGATHTPEAEQVILGFLNKAGASLGGSKSLVDQSGEGAAVISFMSHLNQIGQTGSSPRHPKGLATCCHGEEPHVVGWRFVPERRAVNLDANCGWAHGKADVLYVADAFEVMRKVNELLG
jgi:electron transfer flavoprotein alpha subunit